MTDRLKTRTKYSSRFKAGGMHDIKEICRSVSSSALFAGISRCDMEEMVCRARTLEFASGDVLESTDGRITQVLLLMDGRIKRAQFSENREEVVLGFGDAGEIISVPTLLLRG